MLNQIKITKLEIYAFHGCNPGERKKGGPFNIDLEVDFNFMKSTETDDINLTLDYAMLTQIIQEEMQIPSNLIETVNKRILDKILIEAKKAGIKVDKLLVRVTKLAPPLNIKTSGISSVIIYENI